jgi:urea ABC transporter ATP-binding protein UrtE
VLRIENLSAGYGRVAILNGVSMTVQSGEIVGMLGRNGMGKSTLLRAIVGLVRTREGAIYVDGTDVSRLPAHARVKQGIGYVPQGRMVFPRLSVRENLQVAAFAAGEPDSRVDALLESFPFLRQKAADLASSLSGGQQQLLAIARALATDPSCLLLDEPTEGIQPTLVAEIGQRVRALNRELGVSVLLVEQNLEFAVALASRVYLLDKGRVAAEVPSMELLTDKQLQHEFLGI